LSTSAIATRYAKALLGLGTEQQLVEQYSEELCKVSDSFAIEPFLRLILESPTFPLEKKQAILSDLAAALELSAGMRQFLGLLLDKRRIDYLAGIQATYRALADDLAGVVRAQISTAMKPLKKQTDALQQALEKATGKQVALTVEEDKALLGGVQARIAGQIFDGSIRAQLKRMADTLQKG